ncbi:ATP-dependent helicase, partial [Vibrio cholerae]
MIKSTPAIIRSNCFFEYSGTQHMSFSSLALSADLIQALPKAITEPTTIQTLAIPAMLTG